jgi:hypothetical protein
MGFITTAISIVIFLYAGGRYDVRCIIYPPPFLQELLCLDSLGEGR